jgi:hypothetical protein
MNQMVAGVDHRLPVTLTPSIRDSIRSAPRASETASVAHALTELSSRALYVAIKTNPR